MTMVYLDLAWRQHRREVRLHQRGDLVEAIAQGVGQRIRPLLMTALRLVLGLMPILLSSGTGADVMKRIAAPLLGGMVSALIMTLLVLPAVFSIWRERELEHCE